MKIQSTLVTIILVCLGFFSVIQTSQSAELYFIDAHSQADEAIDRDELLQRMAAAGIQKTILSSRRKRSAFDPADWAESHPNKIIASVRVKSKHYKNNTPKFRKKIKKQLKSGRFKAMSEVLLYHAQKGEHAKEVIVYPDDERLSFLLRQAKKLNWPLVIHIEFAALHGDMREEFFNKMQTLLVENPDQPFCLNHMGQLKSDAVAELIKKHQNLYFITAHTTPMAVQRSRQPWVNMFQGRELAPDWKSLVIKHPDRFIFGIDNVWADQWRNDYKPQVELWREALLKLPADVAHKVAHGNAERLWGLH